MKLRKLKWKKVVSAVVAASMMITLAPVDVSASSAQSVKKVSSVKKASAQSIDDVLEQADKTGEIGTGVSYWYFAEAIEGVVDAGTFYVKGTEGTESLNINSNFSWDYTASPVKAFIVKNISAIAQYGIQENFKKNCKSVKLEGVTTLNNTLSYWPELQSIDLGDDVTSIGDSGFSNCPSLTHISLPAGVKQVTKSAFANCVNLRDVALRTTAEDASIAYGSDRGGSYHPFKGCNNLTVYVAVEGNAMSNAITGFYTGNRTDYADANDIQITMSTLDKYDAKSEASGELTVTCPDVRLDKLPPQPEIAANTTGIAASNVKWLYFNSSKSSVNVSSLKMGSYYVKAMLQDEKHFAVMSEYVPFTVNGLFEAVIEDGVLTIGPGEGIESCEIPDFSSSYDSTRPWYGKEFSSVVIKDGITAIGNYAFANTKIKSITLGKDVQRIGNYAFESCGSLEDLVMSDAVTEIGQYAFASAGLKSIDLSATQVTAIGNRAFQNCKKLEKIKLPSGLTTLGTYVFSGCSALRAVLGLEDTQVTEVPMRTFASCTSLENIVLSEKVTSIASYAFNGAAALKNVVIPGDDITIAAASAFTNVTAAIYVKTADIQAAVRTTLSSLTAYSGDADKEEAEQKIRMISEGSTKKVSCLSIALGSDEINSGESFAPTITEKIGDGEITYYYYQKSGSTYELVDGENPTAVPTVAGTYYIQGHMAETAGYYGCTSNMVSCMVNGVYDCEEYNFNSTTGVLTIKADINTRPWETRFLNYATKVKEVQWSDEVVYTKLPNFKDYKGLIKAHNVPLVLNSSSLFAGCTSLKEVILWEEATMIPSQCFQGCTALAELEIPDTVTSIGDKAFSGCTSLVGSIAIPDSVKSIGGSAFAESGITGVAIGENSTLETIGSSVFASMPIESITLPSTIKKIGDNAFADCTSLSQVSFLVNVEGKGSLSEIGKSAFSGCIALEEIVLPKKGSGFTLEIGDYCFQDCTALKKVDMSQILVDSLGTGAFKNCTHLEDIPMYHPTEQVAPALGIRSETFANAGTETDEFIINLPGNTNVSQNAFAGSGITEVIWEDDDCSSNPIFKQIGSNAFAGCSRLEKITLKKPDYLETGNSTALYSVGIVNQNFTTGCPDTLKIYATGDTYDLLVKYGYTNAVNYKEVVAEKKTAFTENVAVYKGLDASLYDEEAWKSFQEESVVMAEDTVAGITAEDSTATVFEQADTIDATGAFLDDAYFGEGGLAEGAAQTVAALTEGLDETQYTAESWKSLTDAQTAVAGFMSESAEGATASQVSVFEGMLKAAVAARGALQEQGTGTESPVPGETGSPAPGETESPVPGETDKPAPGETDKPVPGTTNSPAPGATVAPGQQPTVSPEAPVSLNKVTGIKVKAKKKAVTVKWKKVTGAKGYQITYSNKKSFKGAKKVTVKKNTASATIKKLKKGKVYYIKVRAYAEASGKKSYGKWSAVKKAKVK